jgi:hypothetical protein
MVDLKNNPNNKRLSAKTIQMIHCQQTNAQIDLVIPVVASNLIASNMTISSKHHRHPSDAKRRHSTVLDVIQR